jgi:large subunit ribosomal protein L15
MNLSLHKLKSHFSKKKRMRIGRGNSAGKGTYAGKGLKGQKARSGGNIAPGFEGGRTTLVAQTPKARGKGFKSGRDASRGINVEKLNIFNDGDVVSLKKLVKAGLVKSGPVRILSNGNLKKKLQVQIPSSRQAIEKIEKAGGSVVIKQEGPEAKPTEEKSKNK